MRKITTFFIAVLLTATAAKAQYVNIPDANFRAFLQTKYPTAFNGAGQMDTTNSLIVNETNLTCSNLNIANLTGMEHFKNISRLDCINNLLTQLPTLPLNIRDLFCSNNQLTSLPLIPPNVRQLFCDGNPNLQCLPNFPNSCINLITSGTNIKCLPNATTPSDNGPILQMIPVLPVCDASNNVNNCPLYSNHYIFMGYDFANTFYTLHPDCMLGWDLDTTCAIFNADSLNMANEGYGNLQNDFMKYFKNLVYLNCSNTLIDTTTKRLPVLSNKLKYLDCSNIYYLKTISSLPPSIRYLDCSHNWSIAASVDSVAPLPDSLEYINFSGNKLTKLPSLPNTLKTLYCDNNPLITLPTLPKNLKILSCFNDSNITSYPTLPDSLTSFNCSFNFSINSLPLLPNSLRELYCSNSI